MEDDTIKLLRECNAGIKMGIFSLEDVMQSVRDESLRSLLEESRDTNCRLGSRTHEYLNEYHDEGKEPPAMAKAMSFLKTNMKMASEDSDKAAAELVTDGCNMGVKSLCRYLNQYPAAEQKVKKLTQEVIDAEEKLAKKLRVYL